MRPREPLRDSDRLDAATDQNRATKPQPLPPCWSPARATPAPPSPARLSAPGSIAPCDIIVLLLATQIKHKSGTPIHDGPLKPEVTFCVQGVLSPLLSNLVLDDLDNSTHSVSPDSMSLPQLNPVEPPWYGPVCPVVGEGAPISVAARN